MGNEDRFLIRIVRKFTITGNGNAATLTLPAPIRNVVRIEEGDEAEFIFDMRECGSCTIRFIKKDGTKDDPI